VILPDSLIARSIFVLQAREFTLLSDHSLAQLIRLVTLSTGFGRLDSHDPVSPSESVITYDPIHAGQLEGKMKTKKLCYRITIVSLLLIGVGMTAAAQRRGRDWDGYPNWGGSFDLRQTALNAGYNEGSKEGRNDRDRNRHRNNSDFDAYRNATKDYSSRLGDRELYRRYFQLAFEHGYDAENPGGYNGRGDRDRNDRGDRDRNDNRGHRGRNWDRYGTYGGSFQLRQTALNAGYNEGIKQGRNDRRRGRHRNYSDYSAYQNATQDYSSKLGDRELYRRYYREGFENGYDSGYNGY